METKDKGQIEFLEQWLQGMNPNTSPEQRVIDEEEVVNFALELESQETKLSALQLLMGKLQGDSRTKVSKLIGEARFGSKPLMEVAPADLPIAMERLLDGSNPALVIRSADIKDFEEDILNPVQELTDQKWVGSERFPSRGMTGPSSELHLDNFIDSPKPGFRYTTSMAKMEQGKGLFVAAFATRKARNFDREKYFHEVDRINSEPSVRRLYDQARAGSNPAYREVQLKHEGLDLLAVELNPGDVVIWPQGGPGSVKPAWHAIREIGNHPTSGTYEPRQSTSYHFVRQSSDVTIDLRGPEPEIIRS